MSLQIKFKNLLSLLLLLSSFEFAISQKSWNDIINESNGLVLQQRQQVEIAINEEGKLEITAQVYEETQHFGEHVNLFREQSIGYSNTFSEIKNLEAYSLIKTGKSRFKKIPVKDFVNSDARSAGVFYDDQKKISYVFPALSTGSKTILSYTKKYLEPRLWGYFIFSSFFPVEKSEFVVKAPNEVVLKFHQHGIQEDQLKFSKEQKGKYTIYSWSAKQIDKIRRSKGMRGVLHNAPHIIIHVEKYEHNDSTNHILGDVQDLYAWYNGFLRDIDEEHSDEIDETVANIIDGKSTELDKVGAIYNWVQQNIKYIAIEDGLGGFRPRSPNTVFARRYGDCKDMSALIYKMLKLANIPSNLTWIGTNSIPYTHTEVPTPMADNHMVCTYINNSQYYFLDATDQYNVLGIPTSHIQGREALVSKGVNDFELVNVPVVPSQMNYISDSVYCQISNGIVRGVGKSVFAGYKKIPVTNNLQNLEGKEKRAFLDLLLNKGNNKFSLQSVKTRNVSEKNKELVIDYDFKIEDYVLLSSDEIFINPHLSRDSENELIDKNTTAEDIYYPYKSLKTLQYLIEIPEGYEVSYLPDDVNCSGDEFGFSIYYEIKEGMIEVIQTFQINTLKLKNDRFDEWNGMMKKMFAAYKESVVLGKI